VTDGVNVADYQLFHADISGLPRYVAAGSVALILTDPPYHKASVPLYGLLAQVAAQVLQPGGSLLAMCGQSYLPEILALMTDHLRYQWLFASRLSGPGTAVWARRVQNHWRALLWCVNGPYRGGFQGDFLRSNGQDKRFHAWGQSIADFATLIDRFSAPGDVIVDPFCGGGTTGKAALLLGRRFIGLDVDAAVVEKTRRRLDNISVSDTVQAPLAMADASIRLVPCRQCGRDFPPQRSTAAYCSPACRTAAYRARLVTLKPSRASTLSVTA
jgi:hypothetical protein